jgi:general secretion pathway protein J
MPRGYTLVEVLVAMAIFSLVGMLVVSGLYTVLQHYAYNHKQLNNLSQLMLAQTILDQDLWQLADRPIVDEAGQSEAAVKSEDLHTLFFTRRNANPMPSNKHSDFIRVAYELRGHTLYRKSWPVLDRLNATLQAETVVFAGLEDFQVRFLGPDKTYAAFWPRHSKDNLPQALEFVFDLGKAGKIRRVYAPGVNNAKP